MAADLKDMNCTFGSLAISRTSRASWGLALAGSLRSALDPQEAKALGLFEIDAFEIDVAGLARLDVDRPPLGIVPTNCRAASTFVLKPSPSPTCPRAAPTHSNWQDSTIASQRALVARQRGTIMNFVRLFAAGAMLVASCTNVLAHGGGCRMSSLPGQCCHMDRSSGSVHCHSLLQ